MHIKASSLSCNPLSRTLSVADPETVISLSLPNHRCFSFWRGISFLSQWAANGWCCNICSFLPERSSGYANTITWSPSILYGFIGRLLRWAFEAYSDTIHLPFHSKWSNKCDRRFQPVVILLFVHFQLYGIHRNHPDKQRSVSSKTPPVHFSLHVRWHAHCFFSLSFSSRHLWSRRLYPFQKNVFRATSIPSSIIIFKVTTFPSKTPPSPSSKPFYHTQWRLTTHYKTHGASTLLLLP